MSNKILILDYGMGNIYSVTKKLSRLKINSFVSSSEEAILTADKDGKYAVFATFGTLFLGFASYGCGYCIIQWINLP